MRSSLIESSAPRAFQSEVERSARSVEHRLLCESGSFYRGRVRRPPFVVSRAVATTALLLGWPRTALSQPAEAREASPAFRVSPTAAAVSWTIAQLIPSPLYVASSDRVGGGVRWQVTPLLFSFGVAAKPLRFFVIDPVARHSGGIELYVSPEWACCAFGTGTSWIARGGARLYFPLLGRGEGLSGSVGGSYYRASDGDGGSIEAGLYTLFSVIGLTVTVSPRLTGREVMTALQIRYF